MDYIKLNDWGSCVALLMWDVYGWYSEHFVRTEDYAGERAYGQLGN